jgi:hypothetical protein
LWAEIPRILYFTKTENSRIGLHSYDVEAKYPKINCGNTLKLNESIYPKYKTTIQSTKHECLEDSNNTTPFITERTGNWL